MTERTAPWWRRALRFALSGIRSGFGLFARNGKNKGGAEAGAENEPPTIELQNSEEDKELTHSSPKSEEAAAKVEPATETITTAEAQSAAVAYAAVEQTAMLVEQVKAEVVAAAAKVPAEIEAQPAKCEADAAVQARAITEEPTIDVAAAEKPVEIEAETVPDNEPIPEASSPAETSLPAEQDSLSAPVAETEPAPADGPAPIHESVVQKAVLTLPFSAKPAERTTAEKVAAALKARGAGRRAVALFCDREPGVRRAARPAARPDPQTGHRHLRHSHRQNHGAVPGLCGPVKVERHGRGWRVHLHGGAADSHQEQDAAAARACRAGRCGRGSAARTGGAAAGARAL